MNRDSMTSRPHVDRRIMLSATLWVALLLLSSSALLGILARPAYGLLPLVFATTVLSVAIPRLALYLFVFSIFINHALSYSPLINVVDVVPLVVIGAALLDLLLSDSLPRRLPPLAGNFAALIIALAITTVFSVDLEQAWHPIARVAYIGVIALAVCRVASGVSAGQVMRVYVLAAVISSLPAIIGFLAVGGLERSFGWSHATLGVLNMVAFSVALFRYLSARSPWPWLAALAIISGGLYATQSRFPIIMVLAFAPVIVWTARRFRSRFVNSGYEAVSFVGRLVVLLLILVAMGTAAAILKPTLLEGIQWRFSLLLSGGYTGTVRLRLELYQRALEVFAAYPFVGLGPGCFRLYNELVPGSHLNAVHFWLQGLSAHNLFLHYLAETGLVGATAMVALFANLFRHSRLAVTRRKRPEPGDVLLVLLSLLILGTVFLESGWLWGQTGMITALITGLVMRQRLRDPR